MTRVLVALAQPVSVYEAVDAPTQETTIVDVLLGAFAVIGLLAAAAIVLGLMCAGVLIWIRRLRGVDPLEGQGTAATTLGLGARSDGPASHPDR